MGISVVHHTCSRTAQPPAEFVVCLFEPPLRRFLISGVAYTTVGA